MSETKIAIIAGITTLATSIAAWVMGGRQATKSTEKDALTKGADQIVETSGKLLITLEKMVEDERAHRLNCETQLDALKGEINKLRREFNEMKKQ
jgi:TolA-binding protein